jgi:hypothetical protein
MGRARNVPHPARTRAAAAAPLPAAQIYWLAGAQDAHEYITGEGKTATKKAAGKAAGGAKKAAAAPKVKGAKAAKAAAPKKAAAAKKSAAKKTAGKAVKRAGAGKAATKA